jgi:hypothetical protein
MQDMITREITCDRCLKPITAGGFVLTSPEAGLHPIKFAHDSCALRVESAFREEGLTVKTRIADADFLE